MSGQPEVRYGHAPDWFLKAVWKRWGAETPRRAGFPGHYWREYARETMQRHVRGRFFDHFGSVKRDGVPVRHFVTQPYPYTGKVEETHADARAFAEATGVGVAFSGDSPWNPGGTTWVEFFPKEPPP